MAVRPAPALSSCAIIWIPDVLVELKLKAGTQPVLEHPFNNLGRSDLAVRCREQQPGSVFKAMTANRTKRPFIVAAVSDHKFDFVDRTQVIQVGPQILLTLA